MKSQFFRPVLFVGNLDQVDSITKAKEKDMGKIKSYADIVVSYKARRGVMSEMVRYDASTNVSMTTDKR